MNTGVNDINIEIALNFKLHLAELQENIRVSTQYPSDTDKHTNKHKDRQKNKRKVPLLATMSNDISVN